MFFQAIAWAPMGSALARCLFTTVLAWAPAGLLVGSCVFLRFELDSKLALHWAFFATCIVYHSFGVGSWTPCGLLLGSCVFPRFQGASGPCPREFQFIHVLGTGHLQRKKRATTT